MGRRISDVKSPFTDQVLDALGEVFFVFTAEGEVLQWNRRLNEETGYSDEEIAEMHPIDFVPASETELVQKGIEKVLKTGRARFEAHFETKEGHRIPYDFSGSLLEWEDKKLICGTGRNIAEQRQIKRDLDASTKALVAQDQELKKKNTLVELLKEVASAANESDTFEEALQAAVDAVCEYTGWVIGHVYRLPEQDRERLEPTEIWNHGSQGWYDDFYEVTEKTMFEKGEGLPGRVLQSGEPDWIVDVTKDSNFIRSEVARDIGVKGAFGFPISANGRVVAVLEFFSEQIESPDEELLETMASVGTQLGQVAERENARRELKSSEERYRSLKESAVEGIIIASEHGEIVDWNPGATDIFGYEEEEILGHPFEVLIPEPYRDSFRKGIERVCRTGEGRLLGETVEIEGLRKNGDEFPLEISLSSWKVNEDRCFAAILRDITEKRETRDALLESEQKFRALAEQSLVGISLMQDEVYVYVNPAFADMVGYTPEEIEGESPAMLVHPDDWPPVRRRLEECLDGVRRAVHYEARLQGKSGEVRRVEVFGSRITYRGAAAIVSSVLDVTEKRHMEREILQIQEKERKRIGQELHDGIVSELTGITLMCGNLSNKLQEGYEATTDDLEEITELVRKTARQARRLSHGLNPVQLGSRDLPGALKQLASTTQKQGELACESCIEISGELPEMGENAASHLYRIAQEAVNNAVKHAGASIIEVRLDTTPERIELVVRDNGRGMPEPADRDSEGVGLQTMRYRADLIGGQLDITSTPDEGTEVRCRVVL